MIRRGQIAIAISTGGANPALAKHLRPEIEKTIGAEYARLAELLAKLRPRKHRDMFLGLRVDIVTAERTLTGLVAALIESFNRRSP